MSRLGVAIACVATPIAVSLIGCLILVGMAATDTHSIPAWSLAPWLGSALALGIGAGVYVERRLP